MLITTTRTGLTGMPGVNDGYPDTTLLRFVGGNVIQLGKRPTMQLPLVLDVLVLDAAPHVGSICDVGEVLKDESTACAGMLTEVFGEYMTCVPAESPLLAR